MLSYEQPQKYIVETENYSETFSTPVLTAGKSFILGYTNETTGVYNGKESPVIIFDDFTGDKKYVDFDFKVKSSAMKLLHKVNTSDNLKYLFYALQSIKYTPFSHKRIWISEYSNFLIEYRHPQEQNAIVLALDGINQAIYNKKQELFSLDELVKSRFIEMFGDCKKITLQKFCKFQQGTQVPIELQSEQQKDGYLRFLRIIDYTQAPQIPRYVNVKGKIVDEQSVVVVRYGASAGFVGKGYSGILANNLFEIIPDESIMSKYFLYCALKYGNFESEISKKCAGVAMPALSFGIMKDMEIYNPLIELQNEFARFVKLIDKSKFIVQQQIKDLQELLDSKMDEYFR